MSARADILPALTATWSTAREVHARVGTWAFQTVRRILNELAEAGAIEARYEPHPNGAITQFRVPQDAGNL